MTDNVNENVLVRDGVVADPPNQEGSWGAKAATKPSFYKLDWETIEIRMAGGRYVHTLRRPTTAELLQRDAEMQTAVEIGRDGSYRLPDPTADEELNARYYNQLTISAEGYSGEVPTLHKAKAFEGIYEREVYVDEDASVFDDEVAVIEEIGGDPPQFTVRHVFRQPTEEELRQYRRKMQTGEVKPGKRGRQQFVSRSNLRAAIDFYDKWMVAVEGVTVGGTQPTAEQAKDHTDPLVKRMAVQAFTGKLLDGLLD